MVRFSFASFCSFIVVISFAVSALAEPPTREGVMISVSESELANLSPSARATFDLVKAQLEQRLFQFAGFDVKIPESAFDSNATQLVGLRDLYQAPTNQELPSLSGTRLTSNQVNSIQKEGTFVVPSQEYPGQFHVWKVFVWVVMGSDRIHVILQDALSKSANQITIQIWNRLNGSNPLSNASGLRNIFEGLKETVSLVVGLPHEHPLYSEDQVQEFVNAERKSYLLNAFADAPAQLDLRMFNEKLMKPVSARLVQIATEVESDAVLEAQLFEYAELLGPVLVQEGLQEGSEAFMNVLYQRLESRKREYFHERLLKDQTLESLSSGIAQRLVNQGKAAAIVQAEEALFQGDLQLEVVRITGSVKRKHSIRSQRESWLQAEVAKRYEAAYRERIWPFYDTVVQKLRDQGLAQEAYLLNKDLEFLQTHEADLKKELTAETEADRDFVFSRSAWTRKGWTVERSNEDGKFRITAKDKKYVVDSGTTGWRLRNIWERTAKYVNNGLKTLIVDNLYNGGLGFRSLLAKEPFNTQWTVDSATGDFVQLDFGKTNTLRSRLQRLYQAKSDAWTAHERHQGGFFIGKVGKAIHWAWTFAIAELGYGGIAPAALRIGQPTLTLVNAAATTGLVASSIAWGPMSALLAAGVNASIFDFDGTTSNRFRSRLKLNNLFPAVQSSVQVVKGVAQVVGSNISIPSHAVAAGGVAAGGLVFAGARTVIDRAWIEIIKRYAAVPKENVKFLIQRISGPGLASNYFFQIQPNLALLSLLANLEKESLARSRAQIEGWIQEPLQVLQQEWAGIALLNGTTLNRNAPVAKSFYEAADAQLKLVAQKFDPKDRFYSELLQGGQRSNIRLSAADLEVTLQQGASLSKNFFSKLFSKWGEEETKKFWKDKKLASGDWLGVTKFYLASAFGGSILTSLEMTDKNFIIEVANPSATDLVSGLLNADIDPAGMPVDHSRGMGFQSVAQPDYLTGLKVPSLSVSPSSYCATLLRSRTSSVKDL